MLNNLYKKLHIMFTISIMLIITLIIGILSVNYIKEQSVNDSTFFQRMATFMIYQLEDSGQNIEAVLDSYEDKYSIFCSARDADGIMIYKSNLNFPADTNTLLENFNSQISRQLTLVTDLRLCQSRMGLLNLLAHPVKNTGEFPQK